MTEIITHKLLKSWSPCNEGYKRFCELFPNGADLQTAIDGLINDNNNNWAKWLFDACQSRKLFDEITLKGYGNTGNGNSGDFNSGNRNSGNRNSGDFNSGNRNSGDFNSGGWNSGDFNSGNRNSGDFNSGGWNSGGWNSGGWNSGDFNSGDFNSGGWNSGYFNSGYFNTDVPKTIRVFGIETPFDVWQKTVKPDFIYAIKLVYWVSATEMTDADKKADPYFCVRGGQLRTRSYKEAWLKAWNDADIADREEIKNIPNFNKEMFFEISGIMVD
jgi:hypothetical protein